MLGKSNLRKVNFDLYPLANEQLFTELTSEEASLIKGGSVIEFTQIALLESQATNLCLYVNGQEVWSAPIAGEEVLRIDEGVNYLGSAVAELYENCGEQERGNLVGYFDVPAAAVVSDTKYLKGSESEYLMNYRVF